MSKSFKKLLLLTLLPLMFLSFFGVAQATVKCDCGTGPGGGIMDCESCSSCPNQAAYPGRSCKPVSGGTSVGITAEAPTLAISVGNYKPSSTIDCGLKDSQGNDLCSFPWIGQYIAAIFKYGVGIAAILATIMIMIGGFVWLSSGGSPDKVGKAKEFITSAVIGLFLALFSYLMLYTINPRLVASEPILVQKIVATNFICCFDSKTNKPQMASDSGAGCPAGQTQVPNIDCFPLQNQSCESNNGIVGTQSECQSKCEIAGAKFVSAEEIVLSGGNQGLLKLCCICSDDANGQCLTRNESCTPALNNCCTGLICNSYLGDECQPLGNGWDLCNADSECKSRLCNTNLVPNRCTPDGGWGDNTACNRDIECASGICNTYYSNHCSEPKPIGGECNRNKECASGYCKTSGFNKCANR